MNGSQFTFVLFLFLFFFLSSSGSFPRPPSRDLVVHMRSSYLVFRWERTVIPVIGWRTCHWMAHRWWCAWRCNLCSLVWPSGGWVCCLMCPPSMVVVLERLNSIYFSVCLCLCVLFVYPSRLRHFIYLLGSYLCRNDHTIVTAPLPVCSAKLSTIWLG